MTEISPLRRRMIEDMTVRNLSPATQRSYVHAVAKFGRFFGRSPERLGLEDMRSLQVHLVAGGISWPALNQTVCALRFLYGVTLKQADLPERIPYARTPQKLPCAGGRRGSALPGGGAEPQGQCRADHGVCGWLARRRAACIKVADIDSSRMVVRVEHGKADGIATSCSRRSCWASCGRIGGWRGPRIGCFRAVMASIRSVRPCCTRPAVRRARPLA